MNTLDINWLQKIQSIIDNLDRTTKPGSKESRCQKEVFVCRYFKFLNGKCFKIKIKDKVYFIMFNKSTTTATSCLRDDLLKYNSYGVKFYLSYGSSDYEFIFRNEHLEMIDLIVHYNDLLKIKYKEITSEEYFNIVKMFLFEEKLELI
jgi:hypothetical protein